MRIARSFIWLGVLASGPLWGIGTSPAQAQGIAAPVPRYAYPAPAYAYPAPRDSYPAPIYAAPPPRYPAPASADPAPAVDASPAPASGADFYTHVLFGG